MNIIKALLALLKGQLTKLPVLNALHLYGHHKVQSTD